MRNPVQFTNVDLDLKSAATLRPLLDAWSNVAMNLHAPERDGRKHWLRLALYRQPADPGLGILAFCRMARRLRGDARVAWQKASSREFDIGIQAGVEHRSAEWELSRKIVDSIHDVGGHIRLTVYSPFEIDDQREQCRQVVPVDRDARRILRVVVGRSEVRLYLVDGTEFYLPLSRFYRLSKATRAQRVNWELIGGGRRVYWPDIDEDIAVADLP